MAERHNHSKLAKHFSDKASAWQLRERIDGHRTRPASVAEVWTTATTWHSKVVSARRGGIRAAGAGAALIGRGVHQGREHTLDDDPIRRPQPMAAQRVQGRDARMLQQ